jgi:hypothetical protein
MSQKVQEESTMTIQTHVSASGALLLFQSEIEVNRTLVSRLNSDSRTRRIRQLPRTRCAFCRGIPRPSSGAKADAVWKAISIARWRLARVAHRGAEHSAWVESIPARSVSVWKQKRYNIRRWDQRSDPRWLPESSERRILLGSLAWRAS